MASAPLADQAAKSSPASTGRLGSIIHSGNSDAAEKVLDSILRDVRANTSQPVIAVLHMACPRVAYTDRGKTAIVVEGDVKGDNDDEEE